jgi:hypothetical protein
VSALSPAQIANMQLLGKVWGFLKYHDPQVTSGKAHWDYELFRILPAVLKATDAASAQEVMDAWVATFGDVKDCEPCAKLDEADLHLRPKVEWIADTKLLGDALSRRLQAIHRNRPTAARQFYVSLSSVVGNPSFEHELRYSHIKLPDFGFQLLGVFRMWNIIEYWFPYRHVLHEDWDQVLREFIPRVSLAQDANTYQLEMMALIARVHDTHANLWSSIAVRPPVGTCMAPLLLRFIGAEAVVTGFSHAEAGPATTLRAGDILESVDGVAVKLLVERWSPYYAASNDPTRLRDIASMMLRGECNDALLRARRGTESFDVKARRLPIESLKRTAWHDLPGETFRKL